MKSLRGESAQPVAGASFDRSRAPHSNGLFGYRDLQVPSDFVRATKEAIRLASFLLESIVQKTNASPVEAVRSIDMISDLVCRVCDSAELCRQTHVDASWRKAAEDVYEEANAFIFALNANRDLYQSFKDQIEAGEGTITEDALHTATQLLVEFEREGIHCSDEDRSRLQQLNSEIIAHTTMFQQGLRAQLSSFHVSPRSVLERHLPKQLLMATIPTIRSEEAAKNSFGMHTESKSAAGSARDEAIVATNHHVLARAVQSHVPHPCIRRRFHLEEVHGEESNTYVLTRIVALREQVARTVGFPSYADMMCSDRMSGSQANVLRFLLELSERIKPLAEAEAKVLLGRKQVMEAPYVTNPCVDAEALSKQKAETGGADVDTTEKASPAAPVDENDLLEYVPDMGTLEPWDYTFYVAQLRGAIRDSVRTQEEASGSAPSARLGTYLTLGNVLRGLSMITETSFGVRLERQDLHPTEDWSGAGGHGLTAGGVAGGKASGSDIAAGKGTTSGEDPVGGEVRDVMRFVMRDTESDRELGVMYLDLFHRQGKRAAGAAHYVVRCGRRLARRENPVDTILPEEESVLQQAHQSEASEGARDREGGIGTSNSYQLPIVALVTSYNRPADLHDPSEASQSSFGFSTRSTASPSLEEVSLTFGEAETLFHEYGHALHSILSRTQFQHVWGTRGALDFIELPSHLFEKFLSDYRVASRFMKCPETGAAVPRDMFEAHVLARRSFGALELQQQVVHCMFDQALFANRPMQVACSFLGPASEDAPGGSAGAKARRQARDVVLPQSALEDPSAPSPQEATDLRSAEILLPGTPRLDYGMRPGAVDSQALLQEVARRHSLVPYKARTRWQAGFGHVVNYGACYYSYLYARVFAQAVWSEVFEADPLCPDAGRKYRSMLLEKGGAEDPRGMLKDVLGYDPDPRQLVDRIFGQLEDQAKASRAGRSLDSLAYRRDSRLASLMSDKSVGLREMVLLPI